MQLGADYSITASAYTLPFHTHWAAVWPALCPIDHLRESKFISLPNMSWSPSLGFGPASFRYKPTFLTVEITAAIRTTLTALRINFTAQTFDELSVPFDISNQTLLFHLHIFQRKLYLNLPFVKTLHSSLCLWPYRLTCTCPLPAHQHTWAPTRQRSSLL